MRVLITGASGFIGKPLSKKLSKLGCEVLGLTRSIPLENQNSIDWLESNLSSPSSYRDRVELFQPEVLIHLAWQDIPDFSVDKSIMNLNHSLEFLSFVAQLGSCKKILISGSCLEYGKVHGECKDTDKVLPNNYFTLAKNSLHLWIEAIAKEKSISLGWFRLFYVFGPGQRKESLIPSILNHLKIGTLPEIKTPSSANDYIFIDDVVEAFIIASYGSFNTGVYNLGTGKSTSTIEVCRHAEQIVLNSSRQTEKIKLTSQNINSNVNFWAGIRSSKEQLKWSPKISIEEGIKKSWDQLK